jgi:peptide/nickel transport system substrate-binding protein
LIFNNRVITDKRIRQAVWYAIDRQGIIDGILSGRGTPLKAPPAMSNYEGLNDYAYNTATARSLLQEAGWDSGKTARFIYDTAWPAVGDIVPVIQQQLGEAGMTIELEPLDTATWTDRYRNQPDSWDIAWGQGGTEALDPDVSTTYYNNNPDTAIGFYTNDALQELFVQGRSTGDEAQRDQIYAQAAKIINDEVPVIYLWAPFDIHAKVTSLQNVTVFPYAPETGNDITVWSFA